MIEGGKVIKVVTLYREPYELYIEKDGKVYRVRPVNPHVPLEIEEVEEHGASSR